MLLIFTVSFIYNFQFLLSPGESDSLDDESNKLGSDSRFSGTYSFCAFSLCFYNSVSSVIVLVYDVFAPTGVISKGDTFVSGVFLPTGFKSKGGRLIEKI